MVYFARVDGANVVADNLSGNFAGILALQPHVLISDEAACRQYENFHLSISLSGLYQHFFSKLQHLRQPDDLLLDLGGRRRGFALRCLPLLFLGCTVAAFSRHRTNVKLLGRGLGLAIFVFRVLDRVRRDPFLAVQVDSRWFCASPDSHSRCQVCTGFGG